MNIPIRCQNFSPPLLALNGQQRLDVTPLKLLLACLVCGYDGFFKRFGEHGFRRIAAVAGNVLPYLRTKQGGLTLHPYYFQTDSSENKHGAYYIGQGLTKLFSEQHLNAPLVLHASGVTHNRAVGNAGKAPHLVLGRELADLISFGKTQVHVLEAKGRSVRDGSGLLSPGTFNSVMQEALVQVSAVQHVNGRTPTSRCACVWTLCTSGLSGDISDPEGEGWDVKASDEEVLESNYRLFLDLPRSEQLFSVVPGYLMTEVRLPKQKPLFIGIQARVLEQLQSGQPNLETSLDLAQSFIPSQLTEGTEVLKDGTIIYAPYGLELPNV